jgi:hypothetical protein
MVNTAMGTSELVRSFVEDIVHVPRLAAVDAE